MLRDEFQVNHGQIESWIPLTTHISSSGGFSQWQFWVDVKSLQPSFYPKCLECLHRIYTFRPWSRVCPLASTCLQISQFFPRHTGGRTLSGIDMFGTRNRVQVADVDLAFFQPRHRVVLEGLAYDWESPGRVHLEKQEDHASWQWYQTFPPQA